jgi:hypothetical protein
MLRRFTFRLASTTRVLPTAAALFLCLSAAYAQTGAAARVMVLTGRVDILRDNTKWALNTNDQVLPKQIVVTGPDGYAKFQVSDGSTFEVFQNSQTVFRANAPNWRDLLDVLLGRVKVHIEKLNGQPNDTKVHTPTAIISVRGTTFDVAVEPGEDTTVSVEEGRVEVEHKLLPSRPAVLNPGDSIHVYRNLPLNAAQVDKSGVLRAVFRAAEQAIYDAVYRRPGGGGGSTVPSGGATSTADKDKNAPPPTPPPPPPGK